MTAAATNAPTLSGQILDDRRPVLRRTVRGLSDPMLPALARGLRQHREDLVTGHLFLSRDGGGCVVGVMLRELDPDTYSGGPMRFWLRHRWRRRSRSYGGQIARNVRLRHLEWIFDTTVKRLRRVQPSARLATRTVGDWIRIEVETEIQWRSLAENLASDQAARLEESRQDAVMISGERP